jgi:RHS repeat-associated protein
VHDLVDRYVDYSGVSREECPNQKTKRTEISFTFVGTKQNNPKVEGESVVETSYIGGIQYTKPSSTSNWVMDFVQTAEGRITNPTASPVYEYDLKDHLGNSRVVFRENGVNVSTIEGYYPFGMAFETPNEVKGSPPHKYLYQGKEYQNELGLDTYDFEWRMYDPATGRTFQLDPHAENYISLSPYSWTGNNPIIKIDPDGRDWYQDEDGNVKWVEGSAEIEGYMNIGAQYTLDYGNGYSITFNQNDAQSLSETVFTEDQWASQITNGVVGNCYTACTQMLTNAGVETAGSATAVLTASENVQQVGGRVVGYTVTPTANAQLGIDVINATIDNGQPLIVGVDYRQGSPNDGITDHFVVVGGRTTNLTNNTVTYRFFDPRTAHRNFGASPNNTFSIGGNNLLTGTYSHGTSNYTYRVSTVRRNR